MFLAVRPEDLTLPPGLTEAFLAQCDPLEGKHLELDPTQLALLLMGMDAGQLPLATELRASRNIGLIQDTLTVLEARGLITPAAHDARWRTLARPVHDWLTRNLIRWWQHQQTQAWAALTADPWRKPRDLHSPMHQWLRDLLIFVAHRGVRLNSAGQLHKGDLRRYLSTRDLPDDATLQHSLSLSVGLGILFPLGERLLIGETIDIIDESPETLAKTGLEQWVQGRVMVGLAPLTNMSGLLSAWQEPLAHKAQTHQGAWMHGADHGELMTATIAAVPSEPCSYLVGEARSYDLRQAAPLFLQAHRRLRAGWMHLTANLPRGVELRPEALIKLYRASTALELLRRPVTLPRRAGPASAMFASASWLLPAFQSRHREALLPWLHSMLDDHGLLLTQGDALVVHPKMPQAPLPHGAAELHGLVLDGTWDKPAPVRVDAPPVRHFPPPRLILQPNGEVLAPPGISIHTLVHLACGARPSKLDQVAHFVMDKRSLMRLVDSSMDPRVWGQTLGEMTGIALPIVMVEMLEEVARRDGEISLAPVGGVLVAKDPVRLQELLSYPKLAKQVVMQPTPTLAILAPGCDLSSLVDLIGDRGFSGILVEHPSQIPPPSAEEA